MVRMQNLNPIELIKTLEGGEAIEFDTEPCLFKKLNKFLINVPDEYPDPEKNKRFEISPIFLYAVPTGMVMYTFRTMLVTFVCCIFNILSYLKILKECLRVCNHTYIHTYKSDSTYIYIYYIFVCYKACGGIYNCKNSY